MSYFGVQETKKKSRLRKYKKYMANQDKLEKTTNQNEAKGAFSCIALFFQRKREPKVKHRLCKLGPAIGHEFSVKKKNSVKKSLYKQNPERGPEVVEGAKVEVQWSKYV